MAVISDFPNQSSGGGARPTSCLSRIPRYPVAVTHYEDEGVSTNMPVETATKRWALEFVNLDASEAAAHDLHAETARIGDDCSHHTFTFTHPTTAVVYTGCRYDKGGYTENPHRLVSAQNRTVLLVQFPS